MKASERPLGKGKGPLLPATVGSEGLQGPGRACGGLSPAQTYQVGFRPRPGGILSRQDVRVPMLRELAHLEAEGTTREEPRRGLHHLFELLRRGLVGVAVEDHQGVAGSATEAVRHPAEMVGVVMPGQALVLAEGAGHPGEPKRGLNGTERRLRGHGRCHHTPKALLPMA